MTKLHRNLLYQYKQIDKKTPIALNYYTEEEYRLIDWKFAIYEYLEDHNPELCALIEEGVIF